MDAHHASTGIWPTVKSGQVQDASPGLTWCSIQQALHNGYRGLPAGWTLPRLRREYREPRPELTVDRILAWADAHHAARGCWPTRLSGGIEETGRETWMIVDTRLRKGGRGLPGGESLARLLLDHRGVRIKGCVPRLTVEQIVAWAEAHLRLRSCCTAIARFVAVWRRPR